MKDRLPVDWLEALGDRLTSFDLGEIESFVDAERSAGEVYPPEGSVFRAFELTPFAAVRAVILGQDPYHEPGQAEGLAFSVAQGDLPRSLKNIFRELQDDLHCPQPTSGSLRPWARHGVLLLNTVLTVRRGSHSANSHAGHGWEQLTSAVVDAVATRVEPVALLLWGRPAQTKGALIDARRHVVVPSAHPSPLSARRGFLGSKPFSRANDGLRERNAPQIDWCLTD